MMRDHRCSARYSARHGIRTAFTGAILAAMMAAASADAQTRADGRTWWAEKRQSYPQCSSFTNQHEALTDELDRLAEKARYEVEPQRAATLRQLNATAQRRNAVQDQLFACIRAGGGAPIPPTAEGSGRRPQLRGGVEGTNRPGQPPLSGGAGSGSYPNPQIVGGTGTGGGAPPWVGTGRLPGFKQFSAETISVNIRDYVANQNSRQYSTSVELTDAQTDPRKAFTHAQGVVNLAAKTFTIQSVVDRGGNTHPVRAVTIRLR